MLVTLLQAGREKGRLVGGLPTSTFLRLGVAYVFLRASLYKALKLGLCNMLRPTLTLVHKVHSLS